MRRQPRNPKGSEALLSETDRVEQEAWSDIVRPPGTAATGAVRVVGDGHLALVSPGIDHLLLNRAFLRRDALQAAGDLTSVLDAYRSLAVERFMVHVPEADCTREGQSRLRDAGLERFHRDWVKLARSRGPVAIPECELQAGPLDSSEALRAACIVTDGFDLPRGAAPLFASLYGRRGWHLFAARDHEGPVAMAGLYVSGPTAYLAFGACSPKARRRGAQSMLIAMRLRLAFDLGASLAFSETGEAVTGEPQHSYGNLRRAGLEPLCARPNWVPRGVRW